MKKRIQAIKWCGYNIAFCNSKVWAFNYNGTKEVGPVGCFKDIKEAARYLVRNELGGLVPDGFPSKEDKIELSDELRKIVEKDIQDIKDDVIKRLVDSGLSKKRAAEMLMSIA